MTIAQAKERKARRHQKRISYFSARRHRDARWFNLAESRRFAKRQPKRDAFLRAKEEAVRASLAKLESWSVVCRRNTAKEEAVHASLAKA